MMASTLFNLVFMCPWQASYWRKEGAVQFRSKTSAFIRKKGVVTLASCYCSVAVSLMPSTPSLDLKSLLFVKTVIFHRLPQKETLVDVTDIVLGILFCPTL